MGAFAVNGEGWRVAWVEPGDPRLVDRQGKRTVGTADPLTRTVHISAALAPPEVDRVLLHEVAHAITMSYGGLDTVGEMVERRDNVAVEEWAANLMENHSIEAAAIASQILGRPLCIRGWCYD